MAINFRSFLEGHSLIRLLGQVKAGRTQGSRPSRDHTADAGGGLADDQTTRKMGNRSETKKKRGMPRDGRRMQGGKALAMPGRKGGSTFVLIEEGKKSRSPFDTTYSIITRSRPAEGKNGRRRKSFCFNVKACRLRG